MNRKKTKQRKPTKKKTAQKKPTTPLFNVHHPEVAGKFEVAFTCKGVKYYRAVKDFYLPVGRHKFIDTRLSEADLRMTSKMLMDYVREIKKIVNVKPGVEINMIRLGNLITDMETHCDLQFEPETIKRLAAVVYVDETEDLRDFDEEYGEKKIKFWEENGNYAFFLTRPISELFNLHNTSEESLKKFMKIASQIKGNLTSDLYTPSSENK